MTRDEASDRARVVFTILDGDRNGVLERSDFELMAERVETAAWRSAPAQREALRAGMRRWWEGLVTRLDSDGDGRIDFEEYRGTVLSPGPFADTVASFAHALAALGDPEGVGTVARGVFVELMTAVGFPADRVTAVFDAFGPSADDRVPVAVWEAGVRDFFSPDKAGIAGDHLVAGE
ncbi:EF hand [Streptomyces zhaozhouensis]|uniref:EF hand n=1 Tax=Streptomyces zhaozhouensis TaxID=1300267 RepID=A0A286DW48_9ACTN|nr:EF-hand domain-containing protein [Streptomyces zhaozhouensis]SOD62840.1 EF hand [Streptomyces zhaozhouensis]